MRAGVRFNEENYDDPESDGRLIEQVSGYRPRRHPDLPPDTAAWIRELPAGKPHGSAFEYRSILTDVVGWAISEAAGGRFVDFFSAEVWSRIGAERDAEVIVDDAGFAVVEGGMSATARDVARFGLMCLQGGEIAGRQVIPPAWLGRLRERNPDLIAADEAGGPADPEWPDACYHDQWWISDPSAGIYAAYGINGQQLLVYHPSRTVVVKFSTWPRGDVPELGALTDAALLALCAHLEAG
jgi:hypothetical protein